MNILLLLAGLGLILAGANLLTDGAAALAQRFRVPEFIVGLTVIAIGTSTPELVVSVLSAIAHNSDIAVGNVVLNRVASLFSRRAFNIDSLAVGVTDDPSLSRMTIIVDNGNSVVEQVEKQLNKLVEVIKVRTLDEGNMIGRELMIIKVSANRNNREHIMTICNICGAKAADISPTSMTLEISDTPDRVDVFEEMMRPFNILEVARTGVIALQKGGGKI